MFSLSPACAAAVAAGLSVLLWRWWTFTIAPCVHPERPNTLPYWIPGLGHTLRFIVNGDRTITQARLYFQNTRKPFALVIGGQYTYIITSAKYTAAVFKNVAQLSFDSYLKDMSIRFGMSPSIMEAAWQAHAQTSMHPGAAIAHAQLLPGPQLAVLQNSLLGRVHDTLTWTAIPNRAVLVQHKTEKIVSLKHWVRIILVESTTRALFGKLLLEIEPKVVEALAAFDLDGWKFTYQVPAFLSRTMLQAKKTTQDALRLYFESPVSERGDACWMVQALEKEMKELGATADDMSATMMLFYWVANTNAWKAALWMIARILFDPELRHQTQMEIASHFSTDSDPLPKELHQRLETSTLLNAIYDETLRTTASSISVRDVLEDCIIGNSMLQKGSRLVVPFRQMLLDEQVFGPDADKFNPGRFIENPALAKDPSFRPFGGGVTLCPGRFLARAETMTVVALLLHRFSLQLHDADQQFPDFDTSKPGLGIIAPVGDQDVVVSVKERFW